MASTISSVCPVPSRSPEKSTRSPTISARDAPSRTCLFCAASFMLPLEPFAGVMGLADVNAVLQEVGEGAVGEGYPAPEFCNFGLAAFGDNLAAIQFGHQLAEGFVLQIKPEDGADGFSLSLVDDQFLILCIVTERHGAAGPFTLSPAG